MMGRLFHFFYCLLYIIGTIAPEKSYGLSSYYPFNNNIVLNKGLYIGDLGIEKRWGLSVFNRPLSSGHNAGLNGLAN